MKSLLISVMFLIPTNVYAGDLQTVMIDMLGKAFESGCLINARHNGIRTEDYKFCSESSSAYKETLLKELKKKTGGQTDDGAGVSW